MKGSCEKPRLTYLKKLAEDFEAVLLSSGSNVQL